MKSNTFLSQRNIQWLGIILVFLAFLSIIFILISNRRNRRPVVKQSYKPLQIEDVEVDSVEEENLFKALDFQKVHMEFQKSYLDVIKKINEKEKAKNSKDTIRVDIKKDALVFETYKKALDNYSKVLKKIEDHEKDYKLKCFARMRKIILGVLYADKKLKKRVTKFDAENLVEIGALDEIPVCPRDGEYSIIYKNGRRLFNCSIHGILKN